MHIFTDRKCLPTPRAGDPADAGTVLKWIKNIHYLKTNDPKNVLIITAHWPK